jgi:hypothetical protein
MMCYCGHGSDRHYLDYAGPGVCGGVFSRCLSKDCPCVQFRPVVTHSANTPAGWITPDETSSQGESR